MGFKGFSCAISRRKARPRHENTVIGTVWFILSARRVSTLLINFHQFRLTAL